MSCRAFFLAGAQEGDHRLSFVGSFSRWLC